ncbi:MAG: 2'-5' RNA ligase family protein [Dehalococcoidia bacterium]|nr:2'-5' RNA ligase family protein [Dehalococcoidia bacterium]
MSLYTPDAVIPGQVAAVRSVLKAVCRQHKYLECTIDGFGRGEGKDGHFVYYRVLPSEQLMCFRDEIARRLAVVCPSPKPFERPGVRFLFHITIAYRLSQQQADRIWSALDEPRRAGDKSLATRTGLLGWLFRLLGLSGASHFSRVGKPFRLHLFAVRVALIGDGQRIVCEYDLPHGRLLSRSEALDRHGWSRSIETCRTIRAARTRH